MKKHHSKLQDTSLNSCNEQSLNKSFQSKELLHNKKKITISGSLEIRKLEYVIKK